MCGVGPDWKYVEQEKKKSQRMTHDTGQGRSQFGNQGAPKANLINGRRWS